MRRSVKTIALGMIWVAPFTVYAQARLENNPTPAAPAPTEVVVGGTSTVDLITIRNSSPSMPLRYGSVISGSDSVELAGKALLRGRDYTIDLESGVIYLMVPVKPGQTAIVSYRYAAQTQKSQSNLFSGAPTYKFDLLPGQKMLIGLGMTERQGDGNVITTNIYGWNNTFKFGNSGSVGGLMLYGSRQKNDVRSNYEYQNVGEAKDLGNSSLTLQKMDTQILGGNVVVSYQDVSDNFSAFSAVQDAGYEKSFVDQLKKEKGLKRLGVAMNNLQIGSLGFTSGLKSIADKDGGIEWKNFGVQSGGLKLSYSSQEIDKDFKRFADLAETDREQLRKEAGMTRNNFGADFAQKATKMSYSVSNIEDGTDKSISQKLVRFESNGLKFNYGEQEVEAGFGRIGSLTGKEQQQFSREVGLQRQWMGLDYALSKSGLALKFSQSILESKDDQFVSKNLNLNGRTWSLEHVVKDVGSNFANLPSLQDQERNDHLTGIARMYDKNANGFKPDEIGQFFNTRGIRRELSRVTAQPFKNWSVQFDALSIEGQKDDLLLNTFQLNVPGMKLSYRKQETGKEFNEISALLNSERQRLSTIVGLEKSDLSFDAQFGKTGKLQFSTMNAESPLGDAKRTSFNYSDSKIDVKVNNRSVDNEFNNVAQLIDPEKDYLSYLRGFEQRDAKVVWQILPNLKVDTFIFEADNDVTSESRKIQDTKINWALNKGTQINMRISGNETNDPMKVLFDNALQQISLFQNLGKYGNFAYLHEKQTFDGSQTQLSDFDKQIMAYETKLNTKTSFRAEQSVTRFENGDKEDVSTKVVNTELNKKVGVSISDVHVDRNGSDRDETKRNYGFWWDLGNGLRVIYGYNRQLNGENGNLQSNLQITPGSVGDLSVNSANYNVNRVDDQFTTATSNVQIATKKPIRLGFFTDFTLQAGSDTHSQRSSWLKENKTIRVSGKINEFVFGYAYLGQMHQSGYRGIDRAFSFKTSQNENRLLRASIDYKIRTLPWGDNIMIRNYNLIVKPSKNITLTNSVKTNPEDPANPNVILGSVATKRQDNQWNLDYKMNLDTTLTGTWVEQRNYQEDMVRSAGIRATLFQRSGSPVQLYYGLRQSGFDAGRKTMQEFSLRFDQRPGPNQALSFYIGNVGYQHYLPAGQKKSNWTLRLDYQLRLK